MFESAVQLDPRQELRFVPRRFCFVRVDDGKQSVLGEIVNISLAGLAFRYIPGFPKNSLLPLPHKSYSLDLFQSGAASSLSDLKAWVVYDDAQNNAFSFLDWPPRQCGLAFHCLSQQHKDLLRSFIESARS